MNNKRILKLMAAGMVLSTSGNLVNIQAVKAAEVAKIDSEATVKNNIEEQGQENEKYDLSVIDENDFGSNTIPNEVNVTTGGGIVVDTVKSMEWTFDKSSDGWMYEGKWAYNGPEEDIVRYNENLKALELGVDFTKDSESSWSEVKIKNQLSETKNIKEYNVVKYDFIYNPDLMTKGSFKTKLFINNGPAKDTDINLSNTEDLGDGVEKVQATISFDNTDVDIDSIVLSIIGSNTDYKGNIYIDNIAFGQEVQEEVYVEKTTVPKPQDKVTLDELKMPSFVKLVDSEATESTADLYAYLTAVGKTDKVIYGHQNDTHKKSVYKGGSESDTKDVTSIIGDEGSGSISGIVGIDSLSLVGDELDLTDKETEEGKTLIEKAADIGKNAAEEGAIVTMSCHMPNFAIVKDKEKINGKYDYSGYSPNVTTGDIVSRIMPGGDLNGVFTDYLDLIADYAHELDGTPVLFRPFHENNGSWFWWGAAYCDEHAFKNLLAYTV